MGAAKGIKIGWEKGKANYAVPNPPPRSHLPKMLEHEKLSLFDIDTNDEAPLKAILFLLPTAATIIADVHFVEPANLSTELKIIDVVISDPTVDGALPNNSKV